MGGVAWTEEEDNLLKKCIEQYGQGKWHRVPSLAGLNRCRKSCRLRWLNYLRPNIKRGSFNAEEVDLIIKLHKLLGNRWSLIAGRLPGRTANDVKNYWNCHLSKRISAHEKEEEEGVEGRNMEEVISGMQPTEEESGSGCGKVGGGGEVIVKEEEKSGGVVENVEVRAGELGADLQLDEIRIGDESCSKWDWDDLVLDMDLWS